MRKTTFMYSINAVKWGGGGEPPENTWKKEHVDRATGLERTAERGQHKEENRKRTA